MPSAIQLAADLLPDVRLEPTARRVRAVVNGEAVADSTGVLVLFERGHLPVYYFPRADVRADLLEPSDLHTVCPRKGTASYEHVHVGSRRIENAAWHYPDPFDHLPELADLVAFSWDLIDHWYEEDEEVFRHARDPYHRVDAIRSSRHVQVIVGGEVVADTTRPTLVFETSLPTRYYIPIDDVRTDLLTPTSTTSTCPYKGNASYWSANVGDVSFADIAWTYISPIPEAPKIAGLVCFFDERVDAVVVDGETQARPVTPWSSPAATGA